MSNPYKIELGVDVNTSDIQTQINEKTKNMSIPIKIEIENINDIKAEIRNLGVIKGGIEIPLTIDTDSAVKSAQQAGQKIGSTVSKNVQKNLNIKSVESKLGQITASVNNAEDVVTTLNKALSNLGVEFTGADTVTKDIQRMGMEVSSITTKINGNNLELSVAGIQKTADGLERTVAATKRYKDEIINTEGINRTFSQSFETSADKAKKMAKETSEAFKEIYNTKKRIGSLEVNLIGAEAKGDTKTVQAINDEIDRLKANLKTLDVNDVYSSKFTEAQKADLKELNELIEYSKKQAQNTVDYKLDLDKAKAEIKETSEAFNKLMSLTKQMGNIKVKIAGLDAGENAGQIESLRVELDSLGKEYNELFSLTSRKLSSEQMEALTQEAVNTANKIELVESKIADLRNELAAGIKADIDLGNYENQLSAMNSDFNKLSGASDDLYRAVENVKTAYEELKRVASINTGDEVADRQNLIRAEQKYAEALKSTHNLIKIQAREQATAAANQKLADDREVFQSKIDVWLKKNSAATKQFGAAMLKLKEKAENCDRVTLNHLASQFTKLDKAADKAGLKMEKFTDRISSKLKEYSAYISVAEVFMYISQAMKDMFNQVLAVDTAMTELKKVTDETSTSYDNFLNNAASRAKELGTTVDGLVESTADFARLGYEFDDAQGLAEVANIYAVVGDEIEGVEGATESLISTLTAFKDEANGLNDSDFALSIVDKMNEVSNNFAISSGGIGDALKRSASSMAAANNSLDETIALITAANTVVQDPDAVGTAFKTISMRIRGATTELEEAGLETDGMAESTAKLREEIKALSGVDIMIND